MTALGTLQMLLLAGFGFALLSGALGSLLVEPLVRWTVEWAPAPRHRALLILAHAPWALTVSALLSVMLPSLLGMYWPGHDHCCADRGHSHLCFVHPAHGSGGWLGWLLVGAVLVWALRHIASTTSAIARDWRLVAELSTHATRDCALNAWVVPSATEFCVSVGLTRPRVLASRALVETARGDELTIVLAHERAHGERRDNLARLIARASSVLLWSDQRQRLLAAIEYAAERACDEVAAVHAGDRLRVAETLLAFEKRLQLAQLKCSPVVASFGASSVPQRILAMLEPPRTKGTCSALLVLLAASAFALLTSHDALHHVTESLLARIAGLR